MSRALSISPPTVRRSVLLLARPAPGLKEKKNLIGKSIHDDDDDEHMVAAVK